TDQLVSQATSNGAGLNWEDAFLRPSAANVNSLILALAEEKFPLIHVGIRTARTLLARMADHTATLIETPQLTTLIESAELLEGVSAKTSGAGGGDCGIVLAEPTVDPAVIYNTWQQHGIQPLHLNVTQLGVGLEE
ncbi:MAG: phosphomevalonate kinase, partial [Micrococcus sp.]|nr:phosphomevalonate kinase [Micrococcus sp.]